MKIQLRRLWRSFLAHNFYQFPCQIPLPPFSLEGSETRRLDLRARTFAELVIDEIKVKATFDLDLFASSRQFCREDALRKYSTMKKSTLFNARTLLAMIALCAPLSAQLPEHFYYPLNEGAGSTAADFAVPGNGSTATVTTNWSATPKLGASCLENTAGNLGSLATNTPFILNGNWTIECWINPNSSQPSTFMRDASAANFGCLTIGNDIFVSSSLGTLPVFGAVSPGSWTHFSFTHDEDNHVFGIYINGVLVVGGPVPSLAFNGTSTTGLNIGGEGPGLLAYNGRIDDVRVYGRVRSVTDINSDMNTELLNFGTGQAPQPGMAVMDVSNCVDIHGLPLREDVPGPYFTTVAGGTFSNFVFSGAANQPIILYSGMLNENISTFPGSGQIDCGTLPLDANNIPAGLMLWADGTPPATGINASFNTGPTGTRAFIALTPMLPPGPITTFQAVLHHPVNIAAFTNAVVFSVE